MTRFTKEFALLLMLFPTYRLFGIEACFVNDSDRAIIVTVIAGTDRFEKKSATKNTYVCCPHRY